MEYKNIPNCAGPFYLRAAHAFIQVITATCYKTFWIKKFFMMYKIFKHTVVLISTDFRIYTFGQNILCLLKFIAFKQIYYIQEQLRYFLGLWPPAADNFFCSKIQEHRIIDALPQYLCTHSFIVWWFPKSIAIEDTAILFLVLCQQMNKNIQTNPFQCSLKIKGNNKTFEEINVSSRRKHGPSFPSTFSRTTSCRRKSQSLSFQMNSDRKK